jgi:hypothetical protein
MNYAEKRWSEGILPVIIPLYIDDTRLGAGGSLESGLIGIVYPWTCHAPGLIPWQSIAAISWTDDPQGEFTARVSGVARNYLRIPLDRSHNGYGEATSRCMQNGMVYPYHQSQYYSTYIGLAILWQ